MVIEKMQYLTRRMYGPHLLSRVHVFGVIFIIILTAFHLGIGSNLFLTLVMAGISIVGLFFVSYGKVVFSNIFVLIYSIYSGFAALLIKALLWQPLQYNLHRPNESAAYILMGFISVAICALLSKIFVRGRVAKIGEKINCPETSRRFLIPIIVFGLITKILHTIFSPNIQDGAEDGSGFGGFGSFNFVIALSLSLLIAYIYQHRMVRYKILLPFVVGSIVALSIVNNTKKEIIDLIFIVALSIYAFNIKLKIRLFVWGGIFVLFVTLFASPTLHIMRSSFQGKSLPERVLGFYDVMLENGFNPALLMAAEAKYLEGFSYSYSSEGSYIYPSSMNVDRFMLILPVDQVARGVSDSRYMGLQVFFQEMAERVLPSFLIKKTSFTGADLVAWEYGIRSPYSIARPVIGMTASSLAAGGVGAVLIFPFLFILPVLIFLDYIFGALKGSAWAVFGFATSIFLVEKEIDATLPYLMRDLVIIILFSYFFTLRIKLRRRM